MKLGRLLVAIGGLALTQVSFAAPAFNGWDINKTKDKWNEFSADFLPSFSITSCEANAEKNNRVGYFCVLKADGASVVIDTVNGSTESLWLTYNTDTSLSHPTDVWRAPALLTKMARNVSYGDHISFAKKIVQARKDSDKEVCVVDSSSDSKVCGDSTSTGYEFTIIKN